MNRRLFLTAFIAAFFVLSVAVASASSLVYVKDGNVWISATDGGGAHPVTADGGWSAPSEAGGGTIVALRAHEFVHVKQDGTVLSHYNAQVNDGSGPADGPYDPQVSPDGSRIAYWWLQEERVFHPQCNCYLFETRAHVSATAVDHFDYPTPDTSLDVYRAPSWIGNDRLLVSDYALGVDLRARLEQLRRAALVQRLPAGVGHRPPGSVPLRLCFGSRARRHGCTAVAARAVPRVVRSVRRVAAVRRLRRPRAAPFRAGPRVRGGLR